MSGHLHSKSYQSFIRRLVALRKELGLTQMEIATRLKKPQSWVSKTERGERRLDPIELCELAKAMECLPEVILDLAKSTMKERR